jgi:hypothetical protein
MARIVPVVVSEVPGNYVTGALWNANVKGPADFLENKPIFSAYQATAQSIPTGAFTALTLDTEVVDSDGGHSTVTNTSRYTCQVGGLYFLTGNVVLPSGGVGTRGASFALNGATATGIPGSEQLIAPSPAFATTIAPTPSYIRLTPGDYVQMCAFQNTAGALSTTTIGAAYTSFSVEFVTA